MCVSQAFLSIEDDTDQPEESVFYQVQSLFGHLMESKLQYYVPENFWKVTECWHDKKDFFFSSPKKFVCFDHLARMLLSRFALQIFKMWNKELYVREQQDAYEFFTSLVDQLDEHLKVIHTSPVCLRCTYFALVCLLPPLMVKLLPGQKMGREQIFKNTFQGIFSDQKICKDCPHRSVDLNSFHIP